MVKVYTKTGDQGQTGLMGGKRVSKTDPRIELLGELDELNAVMGNFRFHVLQLSELEAQAHLLEMVQKQLFFIGMLVALPVPERHQFTQEERVSAIIVQMEQQMDHMTELLPPLKNFILPGGSQLASFCHLARTVARRVERRNVQFEEIHPELRVELAVSFLNRLSDYCFVLARYSNWLLGIPDTIWP